MRGPDSKFSRRHVVIRKLAKQEALRYHARTAEIAGQNLAHVTEIMLAKEFGQRGCHVQCPWRFANFRS